MKVFLDVGAHTGETLRVVLDPRYGFDKIFCFEPVSGCWRALHKYRDPRVEILPFGLYRETCAMDVFNPGTLGATVFADGMNGHKGELCQFVRASEWFRTCIAPTDRVFMKLNCEGSECDILEDLLDSGQLATLHSVMIDFDAHKIPSQRHRPEAVLSRIDGASIRNYVLATDAMVGPTHTARIQNWLRLAHGEERLRSTPWNDIRYVYVPLTAFYIARSLRPSTYRRTLQRVLPEAVYLRLKTAWKRFHASLTRRS